MTVGMTLRAVNALGIGDVGRAAVDAGLRRHRGRFRGVFRLFPMFQVFHLFQTGCVGIWNRR